MEMRLALEEINERISQKAKAAKTLISVGSLTIVTMITVFRTVTETQQSLHEKTKNWVYVREDPHMKLGHFHSQCSKEYLTTRE